ncbi:MAG TPA: hypothetical protein VF903_04390 [Nitrospirota bacterium]
MNNQGNNEKKPAADEQRPREVEFSVVNADFGCGEFQGPRNTGTLIDLDSAGIGLLTRLPLQPGNIVKFEDGGASKLGIVMWSVESSDNFRIQVRFL